MSFRSRLSMPLSETHLGRRTALGALLRLGSTLLTLQGLSAAAEPVRSPRATAPTTLAQLGLQEAGQGELRFFGLKVYEARLYVPAQTRLSQLLDRPFALELRYSRRFEGADIARRSIEEIEGLGLLDLAQRERRLQELRTLFPSVNAGDRLLGVYRPQASSPFFFNDQPIGEIVDSRFAEQFFRIWLDPKTSEPRLREALVARLTQPSS